MRLLLDTHGLIWWLLDDRRMPASTRAILTDPQAVVHVSAASAWEIATKVRLGKLPEMGPLMPRYEETVMAEGFEVIAIEQHHSLHAGLLSGSHGDPFDRMLAAQAITEKLTLVTRDKKMPAFGCEVLW